MLTMTRTVCLKEDNIFGSAAVILHCCESDSVRAKLHATNTAKQVMAVQDRFFCI